jgi:hypothetical protein
MAGLLDFLQADDTDKDQYGMTQADRRQSMYSGLIKAGLLGVAAGGNLMPADRAKYLAGAGEALGNIPDDMIKQRSAMAQDQLRRQQTQLGQVEMQGKQADLAQTAKWRQYADSPEFQQAMTQAQATPAEVMAAKAAAYKGDFATVQKILDPKRNRPPLGGGLFYTKDGSVMNSAGRILMGPDGKPPAAGSGGNDTFDASQPNVGGVDRLNLTPLQGVRHADAVRALRIARGEDAPLPRGNPDAPYINDLASQVAGANGTSFAVRNAFEKSLSSGDLNKTVTAPWSASMQHGQEAMEAYDDLMNSDGGKYAQLMNKARNTWGTIDDPELQRKIARYEKAMSNYTKEAEKLIAGSGQITDAVRAEVAPLSDPSKTPAQQVGLMQAMIGQSHARLAQPLQQARILRHDASIDQTKLGLSPEGISSYQWLNNRMQTGPGTTSANIPTVNTPAEAEAAFKAGAKQVKRASDGAILSR